MTKPLLALPLYTGQPEDMNPWTMPDICRHPRFREAYQIALARAAKIRMEPLAVNSYIRQLIAAFMGMPMDTQKFVHVCDWPEAKPDEWQKYFAWDYVECMICHKKARMITRLHILKHGGTKEMYYQHFGIPKERKLMAESLMRHRKEVITHTRIWEKKKTDAPKDIMLENLTLMNILEIPGLKKTKDAATT